MGTTSTSFNSPILTNSCPPSILDPTWAKALGCEAARGGAARVWAGALEVRGRSKSRREARDMA
eukprot:2128077-Pyramimonas_sp.AAC.1